MTFSLNYNAFHKYKYSTYYSNYNNNNVNNRKIIAKYLLSEYFNIKRNKIHPVLFPATACF